MIWGLTDRLVACRLSDPAKGLARKGSRRLAADCALAYARPAGESGLLCHCPRLAAACASANMRPAPKRRDGEAGSITLEASLVAPVVFFAILALILFAAWMLDRALSYHIASLESSRASFAWAHSSADPATGAYPAGAYDGLYWRLADDAVLAGLFGWGGETRGVRVEAGDPETGGSSLAAGKLRKTAARLGGWPDGAASYRNELWKKVLTVEGGESRQPFSLPGLILPGGGFSAATLVTEPAEWVRSFELIRHYRNKFRKLDKGSESYRGKASEVLKKLAGN